MAFARGLHTVQGESGQHGMQIDADDVLPDVATRIANIEARISNKNTKATPSGESPDVACEEPDDCGATGSGAGLSIGSPKPEYPAQQRAREWPDRRRGVFSYASGDHTHTEQDVANR